MPDTCVGCGCPMWRGVVPIEGHARHAGGGKCRRCYGQGHAAVWAVPSRPSTEANRRMLAVFIREFRRRGDRVPDGTLAGVV